MGSFAGPFLASVIGAARIGTGYRPSFDVANPAFREWVKLSVPLMLGVSLVTADDWILRHYAASGVGDITRLDFREATVCGADRGPGTGNRAGVSCHSSHGCSMRRSSKAFAETVNDSVYRVSAASLLATGWMMVAAIPLIDLVYRRGKFLVWRHADERGLFLLVLAVAGVMVRARALCTRVLRRGRHADTDGRGQPDHSDLVADLFLLCSTHSALSGWHGRRI